MTTTVHTFAELLASSRVQPDDAPATAAALLWGRIAETHQVPRDSPVAQLGVVDRVVLVLLDVAQLSPTDVARHLNTNVTTVLAAHSTARTRVGLPARSAPTCRAWNEARASHREGDPAVIEALLAHVDGCRTCMDGAAAGGRPDRHPRRLVVAGSPVLAGVLGAVPALAATVAVAAAVTAASIAVAPTAADTAPRLETPAVPVLVDDAPGLPTDSAPSGGVRQPGQPALDRGLPATELGEVPTDGTPTAPQDDNDVVSDVPPAAGDVLDDVTETVEDVVDEVVSELDVPPPALPDAPSLDAPAPATDTFGRARESLLP